MNWFDRLFLLGTGLIAIYLMSRFLKEYIETKKHWNLYYLISFTVLTISGLLLIGLGYSILQSPIVVIVAALIPLTLAVGLVQEYFKKYSSAYLVFAIVGFVILSITRLMGPKVIATLVLIVVHSVAGLTIFILPLFLIKKKRVSTNFAWVTVGGTLIGIGGIALAFLKAGVPILSAQIIFMILAPLLLLMCASFSFGFINEMKRKNLLL